jgi:hypothetical protein
MACGSCAERRQILLQAMKNTVTSKPIAPQVKAFNATVRKDISAVKVRLMRVGK